MILRQGEHAVQCMSECFHLPFSGVDIAQPSINILRSNYIAQTGDELAWYTHNKCTSYNPNPSQEWTFTKAGQISSTTRADGINAKGISIRWRAGDFAPQTSTPTTSSTSTTTPDTSRVAQTKDTEMSVGAKAGIGVGVAAAVIIAVAILVWILRRKRVANAQGIEGLEKESRDLRPGNYETHELSSDAQRPAELHTSFAPRAELGGGNKHIAELDGRGDWKFS